MSRGTDRRTVRVAPELWERAGRVAVSNDETLSDVMRRALEAYVAKRGRSLDPPDCGCTDCLLGESVPVNQATATDLRDCIDGTVGDRTGLTIHALSQLWIEKTSQ